MLLWKKREETIVRDKKSQLSAFRVVRASANGTRRRFQVTGARLFNSHSNEEEGKLPWTQLISSNICLAPHPCQHSSLWKIIVLSPSQSASGSQSTPILTNRQNVWCVSRPSMMPGEPVTSQAGFTEMVTGLEVGECHWACENNRRCFPDDRRQVWIGPRVHA